MKSHADRISLFRASALAPAALLVLGGCASAPEKPVAQLAQARALVEQAEQAGAQQFAAADLQRAREQLNAAERKSEDRDRDSVIEAGRLAEQAAADAQLAAARARQGKAEAAADELAASIETLRRESSRGTPQPRR